MKGLEGLNPQQREAVLHYEGPLLILAGAGSGKTRVLTNRIAWLIEEKGVDPWNILAITFTNKAAGEMKDRVERLVGFGADSIWVSTFHSTCARILRRHIDRLGYQPNYTIYDTDDQKTLMKEICRQRSIDTKVYKERVFLKIISSAKDEMTGPDEFEKNAERDSFALKTAGIYHDYQKALKKNNALDFDDLIFLTVKLFEICPDVLEYYRNRFRFILVDEYQDTNTAQFRLVSALAGKNGNLCVVGDDDQSIYRFRGANIQNILNFEKVYPGTKVIRLEQNYRSTGSILDCANSVIAHNRGRKPKRLWTEKESGAKVRYLQFGSGFEEAEYVAGDIRREVLRGGSYNDYAVLYRTNAQSRMLEEKLLLANVPYQIIGGINFYARKEIKDLLCYLKTIDNASDDLAVRRIINIPRRGIGAATVSRIQAYADINGLSFYEAMSRAGEIPGIGRTGRKTEEFVSFIRVLRTKALEYTVTDLLKEILEQTGYVKELEEDGSDEAKERISNIDELLSKVASYEMTQTEPTLEGFLQEISLVADVDSLDDGDGRVVLMTLHSAKGLEFPNVYLTGMEDGLFPSYMSINGDDSAEALEEERRLCYVGITRAMNRLTLTGAKMRMVRGQVQYSRPSRFIDELPQDAAFGTEPQSAGRSKIPEPLSAKEPQSTSRPKIVEAFRQKAFDPGAYKVKKPESLDYGEGDTVLHVKFGKGVVKKIVDGGRDFEVTVDFEQAGIRKLFAGFAKLKKI